MLVLVLVLHCWAFAPQRKQIFSQLFCSLSVTMGYLFLEDEHGHEDEHGFSISEFRLTDHETAHTAILTSSGILRGPQWIQEASLLFVSNTI